VGGLFYLNRLINILVDNLEYTIQCFFGVYFVAEDLVTDLTMSTGSPQGLGGRYQGLNLNLNPKIIWEQCHHLREESFHHCKTHFKASLSTIMSISTTL
jgi:hypothetical protein